MIYVLWLNDMRSSKFEQQKPVAYAKTADALTEFMAREKVPVYSEPGENCYGPVNWGKTFRKGGPLEWFNEPNSMGGIRPMNDEAEVVADYRRWLCQLVAV